VPTPPRFRALALFRRRHPSLSPGLVMAGVRKTCTMHNTCTIAECADFIRQSGAGKGPGYSFGSARPMRIGSVGYQAVVDGEAPVFGLSADIGKTAIPQYLVVKIRSAGWTVRERTGVHPVATGTRSRPNGSSRSLSATQPSRRERPLPAPKPTLPTRGDNGEVGWISAIQCGASRNSDAGSSSVRVPVERDHGFRWKMITQSGGT
jgi:hypothetical protein